tara:strand:- start:6471 stop:7826 length:1356 start_codon:yes stop_codon:yes gene_type:complete
MAIESVFTKLQNNRRKQYEDIAKRQSREAAVGAFSNVAGKFLGTVLNDTLREKTNNFINSAPIMNERIQAKIADDRKRRIGGIQNQIDSSGKSTFEFMFDQHLPSFEEGYRAELAEREGEEGWRDFAANPDVFDADIRSRLTEIITPLAENHDEAYALSQRVGTYEDFNATVELASKNAKPTSVMGLLSRELRGAISGKSRQDFEDEAFLAIQNGPLAQNADAFNTFMDKYEQEKSVIKAAKFTDYVHDLEAPTDRDKVDTEENILSLGTGINQVLYKTVKTITTDRFTGELTTVTRDPEIIYSARKDDPVLAAQATAETLRNTFNYADQVKNYLSTEGVNAFATKVQEAGYDAVGDYTTQAQWQAEGEIFTELLKNPSYVDNPDLRARLAAGYDLVVNDGVELQALLLEYEKEDITLEEYQTQFDALFTRILQNMTRVKSLTSPQEYERP